MNLPKKVPNELNQMLDEAVTEYRLSGRKYLYDKVKALRRYVSELTTPVVYLENELLENIDLFVDEDDKATKGEIFKLVKRVDEIDEAKKQVIAEGDYEKAARLRNEFNSIPNLIIDLVVELNAFKSGFNYYKGKLIIVSHNDASKAQIIQMLNL